MSSSHEDRNNLLNYARRIMSKFGSGGAPAHRGAAVASQKSAPPVPAQHAPASPEAREQELVVRHFENPGDIRAFQACSSCQVKALIVFRESTEADRDLAEARACTEWMERAIGERWWRGLVPRHHSNRDAADPQYRRSQVARILREPGPAIALCVFDDFFRSHEFFEFEGQIAGKRYFCVVVVGKEPPAVPSAPPAAATTVVACTAAPEIPVVSPHVALAHRAVPLPESKRISSVAITADGAQGVTGSWDHLLRFWDLGSGTCTQSVSGHPKEITAIAVDAAGNRILAADYTREIGLWDAVKQERILILKGHTATIRSIAITPDGRRGLSGGDDYSVRLWDLEAGRCLHMMTGHEHNVLAVAISADGKRGLSAGMHDARIRLWDLESGRCLETFTGHSHTVQSVVITPDGKLGLSGGNDRTVRLWDLERRTCLRVLEEQQDTQRVALSARGDFGFCVGHDSALQRWDFEEQRCTTVAPPCPALTALAVDPGGTMAIYADLDECLHFVRLGR